MSNVHLDALRGAAAVIVLLGHTRELFFSSLTGLTNPHSSIAPLLPFRRSIPASQPEYVTIGNEAVIIFFVLSGYLVGGSVLRSLNSQRWSWKKYLTQRATRLWVVLIPALLFGIAVDHIGLHTFLGNHSVYSCPAGQQLVPCNLSSRLTARVVAGNMFFLQSIVTDTAGSNNALWSLANEFWYYLAFPLCLLAFRPNERAWRRVLYLVGLGMMATLLTRSILLLFLIWLLGALVAVVPKALPRWMVSPILFCLPVVLPLSVVLVKYANPKLYTGQWIVAIVFSAGLYVILHSTQPASPTIYKATAELFSRMSYTLYLVHLPLAVFLCACINTPWKPWTKTPVNMMVFLLLNLVLVCFSYGFYLLFEANTERIRSIFRRRTSAPLQMPTRIEDPDTLQRAALLAEGDVSVGFR